MTNESASRLATSSSWMDHEPVRGRLAPPQIIALPGVERMGIGDGAVIPRPPIHHLFGLTPVERGPGFSNFEMPASPWLQTSAGVFLAGVSALAADAPLGGAIMSNLPAGTFGVTSELSMSFLRPASIESKRLTARAKLIDVGRKLGLSEAIVEDAAGHRLSHMTSRYVLRHVDVPSRFDRPEPSAEQVFDTPDPHQRPLRVPIDPEETSKCSGLEYFRRLVAGDAPASPFMELFGLRAMRADEGSVDFSVRASRWFQSPTGTIYGGMLAFLADAVMTAASHTLLPARSSCATLDLKVYFLRPGITDERALAIRGWVEHRGRTLVVTRAEIVNADGKQVVVATGSTLLLHGRPWAPVAVADEEADAGDEQDSQ